MITQAMCTSFKVELPQAIHDLTTDTIKMALFTSAADLSAATTAYAATGESSGTGYVAGGVTLTGATVVADGTTAVIDFADATWAGATVTARGALIYNASKANRAIAVLDFGADKTVAGSTFTVRMPAATAATSVLRLA